MSGAWYETDGPTRDYVIEDLTKKAKSLDPNATDSAIETAVKKVIDDQLSKYGGFGSWRGYGMGTEEMIESLEDELPTTAIRLILDDDIDGSDMYITIYTDNTSDNRERVRYLEQELNLDENTIVDRRFAKLHPDNYIECRADVEGCYYIPQLSFKKRTKGQTLEEWLGGSPKHLDWKMFLTTDETK